MNAAFYHLPNARHPDQAAEMARLEAAGTCLFCDPLDALDASTHWQILRNRWPYVGARLHLLLAPLEHVADLTDLPADAFADLRSALSLARERWQVDAYGLGVRCGDCAATGGTVAHLHVHLVVPKDGAQVRFRIGA